MIHETTDRTFPEDVLGAAGVTLVDFWEPTSGYSGVQAPILERFAATHPGVRVVKVNTKKNPRLVGTFGVTEPALLVFKDGQPLVASTGGVHHSYALERLLQVAQERAEKIPQA